MRTSTQRTLLRAATAIAILCTAAVMVLPTTAAQFSTGSRFVPQAMCDATLAFDCPQPEISPFRAR